MKQKVLLLIVLALGMICINTSAQTKKRTSTKKSVTTTASSVSKHREKSWGDGFIWYKLKKGNLYGVQDIEGNMIIPIQYSEIEYGNWPSSLNIEYYRHINTPQYFRVFSGDFIGIYSREGKCIIPVERHYTEAFMCCEDRSNTTYCYFRVVKNGGKVGLCDLQGREVIPPVYDYSNSMDVIQIKTELKKINIGSNPFKFNLVNIDRPYIIAKKGNMGYLFDLDGNVRWSEPCGSDQPTVYSDEILANKKSYPHILFSSNTKYDYTNYSHLGNNRSNSYSSSSSSNSSSSSSSSSSNSSTSNNNSDNKTTTVVVEHHRDPVPVQEWVQCTSCWGSGNCRNCAGSGTTYIGSNLHRCSMCGGRGRCTTCSGQGGKNITVYK